MAIAGGVDYKDHPKNKKPTVALQMLVKDEFEQIVNIITQAYPFFDELNFTVSDKKTADKLTALMKKQEKVHIKNRAWNDRFDEARNENLKMNHCDYWFWIDADDEFPFEQIPSLVQVIDRSGYDQLLLGYNYAQDANGDCVAFHWRERMFRSSHPFYWKGWVHETPITQMPYKPHRVGGVVVIHQSNDEHNEASHLRNHEILLAATRESDDPRYQLYLGTSLYSLGKYGECVEVLDKFVKVSGNTEDIYRALCCMSECAAKMGELNAAIKFAAQAAITIPEFTQAYLILAEWEMEQKQWHEALEWCKVAESKPVQQGLGVFDPTQRNQIYLIANYCESMLGNFNKALKWLRKLPEKHPARQEFEAEYLEEADAETFLAMLPRFRKYFESDAVLYNSLVHDLKYDTRLRGLREQVVEPKTWGDCSIVILCGESFEEWGPHTLDDGMGGSEEAVVYLSRELAKRGWQVTVYGAVYVPLLERFDGKKWYFPEDDTEHRNEDVLYLPWKEINKADNFNVFVAWRAPDFTEHIKAKVKVVDMHDLQDPKNVKPYGDTTYFFKSQFHKSNYPDLQDERTRVIGNGISKEQFV